MSTYVMSEGVRQTRRADEEEMKDASESDGNKQKLMLPQHLKIPTRRKESNQSTQCSSTAATESNDMIKVL